ncbi:MAG: S26 family signal peptidase [Phycisphaeraceae bacterium]
MTHDPPQPDDVTPVQAGSDAPAVLPDPPMPAPRRREPTADETVKETIESIVIAFILAFVFRAFIVEPFIIPTGSMAPTLLGAHVQMNCASCGYRFDMGVMPEPNVEEDGITDALVLSQVKDAACPMCNYRVVADIGSRVRAGDRILVDKFSTHFADPSRWDVIVFKAPHGEYVNGQPAPRANFIKRLVGLPGERVCILDGNIYVAPAGTEDFRIARKTDPDANRHWQAIQRTAWQPVYYSQYVPVQDARADGPGRDARHVFRVPWEVASGDWSLGTASRASRVYRFKGGRGEIRFAMQSQDEPGTIAYDAHVTKHAYNMAAGATGKATQPIEDIRLACAFTPTSDHATLTLSTTARLDIPENGVETLAATLTRAGKVELAATSPEGVTRPLGVAAEVKPLKPGIATEVELWLVDDEASVWVNGERVIVQRFDLTWDQLARRPAQADTPDVRIAIDADGPAELRRVELDRDLYYFPKSERYTAFHRAQAKRINGRLEIGSAPLDLKTRDVEHDAEFFVLGDNQAASDDGRVWSDVNGWVQQRYFDGDFRPGVVPRSLLVGRAFMVYYPAPHGSSPQAKGIFPNFGRLRFIH